MQTVTTIGFDIAKSVFQVHGVDAAGEVVIRRQMKRRYVLGFFQTLPLCLVGIEACASSHCCISALRAGSRCKCEVLSERRPGPRQLRKGVDQFGRSNRQTYLCVPKT
jgi:hypothetical protein